MQVLLRIKGLSLGYAERVLFRNLNLDVHGGESLAVLGSNGSGKSSFLRAILGLLQPLQGEICWPMQRPHELGWLAQSESFDRQFPMRVRDLVAMGAWRRLGFWTGIDRKNRERIATAMKDVGICDIAEMPLSKLSGGQLRRAMFARVIVQDAPVVLLDEPFSAIDERTEEHLQAIIDRWRHEGRAVVLVVHDMSSVLRYYDRVLLLGRGRAMVGAPADVLIPENLVTLDYLSRSQAELLQERPLSGSGVSRG